MVRLMPRSAVHWERRTGTRRGMRSRVSALPTSAETPTSRDSMLLRRSCKTTAAAAAGENIKEVGGESEHRTPFRRPFVLLAYRRVLHVGVEFALQVLRSLFVDVGLDVFAEHTEHACQLLACSAQGPRREAPMGRGVSVPLLDGVACVPRTVPPCDGLAAPRASAWSAGGSDSPRGTAPAPAVAQRGGFGRSAQTTTGGCVCIGAHRVCYPDPVQRICLGRLGPHGKLVRHEQALVACNQRALVLQWTRKVSVRARIGSRRRGTHLAHVAIRGSHAH